MQREIFNAEESKSPKKSRRKVKYDCCALGMGAAGVTFPSTRDAFEETFESKENLKEEIKKKIKLYRILKIIFR